MFRRLSGLAISELHDRPADRIWMVGGRKGALQHQDFFNEFLTQDTRSPLMRSTEREQLRHQLLRLVIEVLRNLLRHASAGVFQLRADAIVVRREYGNH